ncbi:MAG: right-handed parallel beta-helix repeat-containing protein [Pirellulales bacterium]|nr:right-handed parallel beta-helix repeat-containing protein [Pirellulales bacterium]
MPTLVKLFSFVLLVTTTYMFPATDSFARNVYVDNVGGDDGATGEYVDSTAERSGPVKTLAKALRLAARGDRIVLKKNQQPYREPISLSSGRHSGSPTMPFMIVGNGAIIDGTTTVPERLWEHFKDDVYRFRPSRLRYQQLLLDGKPLIKVPASPAANNPPKLKLLEWCLFHGHIYFAAEKSKRPEDYKLTYSKEQTGITLAHISHVKIIDLTVQGFGIDGINAATDAQDVILARVTSRGNGRSGISVGGASSVTIEQCLVGDNGNAQLQTFDNSQTRIYDSQFLPKSAPAWIDRGGRVYIDGEQVKGGLEKIGDF